jgi:hypothetical protein
MENHGKCEQCGADWEFDEIQSTIMNIHLICPNKHEKWIPTAISGPIRAVPLIISGWFLARRIGKWLEEQQKRS